MTHELTVHPHGFDQIGILRFAAAATDTQQIWQKIQNDLQRSPAYRYAIARLQQLARVTLASEDVGPLLNGIAREAIEAALQQLTEPTQFAPTESDAITTPHDAVPPVAAEPARSPAAPQTDSDDLAAEPPADPFQNWLEGMGPVVESPINSQPSSRLPLPKWGKTLSREDLITQRRQAWEAQVLATTQQLKQTREAKGLSLQELHNLTRITVHQLQVLERGCIEEFPEDIYVRGFIRRIGNALGLDGIALARAIPSLDIKDTHAVLPTWRSATEVEAGGGLRPAHLYLTYAALMAGAAGGLALTLQHSGGMGNPAADLPMPEPTTQSKQQPTEDLSHVDMAMPSIQAEVAPPESLPFLF